MRGWRRLWILAAGFVAVAALLLIWQTRRVNPSAETAEDREYSVELAETAFKKVDSVLAELLSGNVAFNAPERMRFHESRTITVLVNLNQDREALTRELRSRVGTNDLIEVDALQIAPLMEVQLRGEPAFTITPLTPLRQPVGRSASTEWRWDVRADEAGTHTLHLNINALVTVDGERFPHSLNVLNRNIDVEIGVIRRAGLFVESNWQWLLGTVVIPLTLWWWRGRTKSRKTRRR